MVAALGNSLNLVGHGDIHLELQSSRGREGQLRELQDSLVYSQGYTQKFYLEKQNKTTTKKN